MILKIKKNYHLLLSEDEYMSLLIIIDAYSQYVKRNSEMTKSEIKLIKDLHVID